jgi:hypothetical protein
MRVDELYSALSARITIALVRHQPDDWPRYFNGLRDLARRVVAENAGSDLSPAEKAELTTRLIKHIDNLEKWWRVKI